MNNIQCFNNPDFGEVRTILIDGEPWFCLADVCRILEITNVGNVKSRLSERGIRTMDTPTTSGIQPMTYINEPNLYKTIFQSRKPEAEKFSDWVTNDVLPSIRKTGSYMGIDISTLPEEMQQFHYLFQEQAKQYLFSQELAKRQNEQAKRLETLNGTLKGIKEAFVAPSDDWRGDTNRNIYKIAKAMKISPQQLYTTLYDRFERENHVDLKLRQANKRRRMEEAGNTKAIIDEGTRYLTIITEEPKLKALFDALVKKYLVAYCVE